MKRTYNLALVLFVLAIAAASGVRTTRAQQNGSRESGDYESGARFPGSRTDVSEAPFNRPTSGAASATVSTSPSSSAGSRNLSHAEDPLHEADRRHAKTTGRILAKYQASTDPDERSRLSEELKAVVSAHFELRQQIRANELAELAAQLRRLQDLHDRREREKDQIIGDRVRQLLRDSQGLGWGTSRSRLDVGQNYGDRARFVVPVTESQVHR